MSESKVGTISQKDYLKKYLSGNSSTSSAKKKKRHKVKGQGIKIVDDDVDISKMRPLGDDELDIYGDPEDAPQVAGIIDERPEELRFTTKKWKVVNQNDGIDSSMTVQQVNSKMKVAKIGDESPSRSESDLSPPENANSADSDLSPERNPSNKQKSLKRDNNKSDSDLSPERERALLKHSSSSGKKRRDADSPPHKKKKRRDEKNSNVSFSKKGRTVKKDSDSDLSPDRDSSKKVVKKNDSDSDLSPVRDRQENRRNEYSRDNNLRRDNRPNNSSSRNRDRPGETERRSRWDNEDRSSKHENYNNRNDRKDNNYRENENRDNHRENDRRRYDNHERNGRNNHKDQRDDRRKFDRDREEARPFDKKNDKTLDGKRAGLQDAEQLKNETDAMKQKEDEMFGKLSDEYTGRNAQAVKRNLRGESRKTEAELQEEAEKEAKQREIIAKYNKWGKGLKQVEEQEARVKEYMHESSKPLARYKDDQDLEETLKGRERIGDPMLEYMRRKEREKGTTGEAETRPTYKGPYPINRFDIRPGHRWDGVDRSSGYEKSYFKAKSSRVALEEEMYKWSTEDM